MNSPSVLGLPPNHDVLPSEVSVAHLSGERSHCDGAVIEDFNGRRNNANFAELRIDASFPTTLDGFLTIDLSGP